ncbi:MAG TPA: CoA transferase [Solirubrobacteraceae bacterium]|nr:CoA transferase [Solirubrobacteraceae bacterium]
MPAALANLNVLDFSRVLAGPFATMMLADLGAEVVKIEPPGGDETRHWGPPYDEVGDATYFQAVNRNKQSLVLDLTRPADLERAHELARQADVLVENFRPGVTERFGLHYEAVRVANPGVIYCSITGFGRGRGATLPGYDLLIQAVGGLMSITGTPDGEPQKVGVALVDVLAGLFATVGILAALEYRRDSGEGQRVEVDLLSSLLAGLVNQASAYTVGGVVPSRMGNQHPSIAPYEPLLCADRELVLAVGNDRQFGALCDVLGVADLARDPRFETNAARVQNRAALRTALEQQLKTRPAGAWARELTDAGVPAGVVNDIAGAFELARELGLDPTVSIERDDDTSIELARSPIGLSVTLPTYRSAPPRFPRAQLGPS